MSMDERLRGAFARIGDTSHIDADQVASRLLESTSQRPTPGRLARYGSVLTARWRVAALGAGTVGVLLVAVLLGQPADETTEVGGLAEPTPATTPEGDGGVSRSPDPSELEGSAAGGETEGREDTPARSETAPGEPIEHPRCVRGQIELIPLIDKTEYLPGEQAWTSLRARNLTTDPCTFVEKVVFAFQQEGREGFFYTESEPYGGSFGPGEEKQITWDWHTRVPRDPGDWELLGCWEGMGCGSTWIRVAPSPTPSPSPTPTPTRLL